VDGLGLSLLLHPAEGPVDELLVERDVVRYLCPGHDAAIPFEDLVLELSLGPEVGEDGVHLGRRLAVVGCGDVGAVLLGRLGLVDRGRRGDEGCGPGLCDWRGELVGEEGLVVRLGRRIGRRAVGFRGF
jgi:hypothetical protein